MRVRQDEQGQMKIAQDSSASTILISWELIFVPSPFADSNVSRDVGIRFRDCEKDCHFLEEGAVGCSLNLLLKGIAQQWHHRLPLNAAISETKSF